MVVALADALHYRVINFRILTQLIGQKLGKPDLAVNSLQRGNSRWFSFWNFFPR